MLIYVVSGWLAQKFLLKIPGGVLTADGEETLLQVLTLGHRLEQCEAVHGQVFPVFLHLWP